MHSKITMNQSPHPVLRTLGFMALLMVIGGAILFRPNSNAIPDNLLPRWEDVLPATPQMSSAQAIDLLNAYDGGLRVDTARAPLESSLESRTSPLPAVLQARGKQLAFSAGDTSAYDRTGIGQFLHSNLQFQGTSSAFQALGTFFQALDESDRRPPLHVLHFGDSQIEGDRITGHLRQAWQSIWGGSGPGLISPLQPVPSLAMRQTWSGDWVRYTRYGKKDSTLSHDRFGLMAAFATGELRDPNQANAAELGDRTIRFTPHPKGFQQNASFNELHLLLGRSTDTTTVHYRLNDGPETSIRIAPDPLGQHVTVSLDALDSSQYTSLDLRFSGEVPELNGVGFWKDSGIVVHNIAMRGSSGTLFRSLDRMHLQRQLQSLRTGLVILQYGGNAVPYLEDSLACERYGNWFASQIQLFQSILPHVPIVVIGPSDMARKQDTRMETYPQLVMVRDALLHAALSNNALYWDVFEVMGGAGSMAAWVQADPPLASSDHVHFTPRGAKEMAELFRKSMQAEWALWQNAQVEKILVHAR